MVNGEGVIICHLEPTSLQETEKLVKESQRACQQLSLLAVRMYSGFHTRQGCLVHSSQCRHSSRASLTARSSRLSLSSFLSTGERC